MAVQVLHRLRRKQQREEDPRRQALARGHGHIREEPPLPADQEDEGAHHRAGHDGRGQQIGIQAFHEGLRGVPDVLKLPAQGVLHDVGNHLRVAHHAYPLHDRSHQQIDAERK